MCKDIVYIFCGIGKIIRVNLKFVIVLPMSADKTKFSLDKTARICYNRFKAIY